MLGAAALATGHYVESRRLAGGGGGRAHNPPAAQERDQS
jgi:hypothetical protein